MSAQEVVRVQALDGTWEALGTGRFRGVVAEGVEATANPWGPDLLNFQVKVVEPGAPRPDLLPFTPVELEIGGVLVWAGRIRERPSDQQAHVVACQGWQYHLDDDVFQRVYVHTRLGEWRDWRQHLSSDLTKFVAAFNVESGAAVKIGAPQGVVLPANGCAGVFLDTGQTGGAKRVVLKLSNNAWTTGSLYVGASDSPSSLHTATWTVVALTSSHASVVYANTFATARRYLLIYADALAGHTPAADEYATLESVQVFADTAYESGDASVLKADVVLKDARDRAAPRLNVANDLIAAGSFSIPEYATAGYQSPRDVMAAVNAYELNELRIGGPDLQTLVYRAKPATPLFEVGEWSGSAFADASVSGEESYNKVVVDATGPDDAPLTTVRTQAVTLLDARATTRAKVLPVRSAVTAAVAERFGDLWLAEHQTAPFSGKLTVSGYGVRRVLGGSLVPPYELLLYAGEKIRLSHRIDPSTGEAGRDGRIAAVRYSHGRFETVIDIDDRRGHFESVLGRYGALTDQLR